MDCKMDTVKQEKGETPTVFDDCALRDWTEYEDVKQDVKVINNAAIGSTGTKRKVDKGESSGNFESLTDNRNAEIETRKENQAVNSRSIQSHRETWNTLSKGTKYQQAVHIDNAIRKLTEDAPGSEIFANLCTFQCPECCHSFNTWRLLKKHFAKMHGTRKLSLLEISTIVIKVVCYTCKICSDKMLCDEFFIKRHAILKHKMTVQQYKLKMQCQKDKANIEYSNNFIDNLCVYQCNECKETFKSRNLFHSHRKKSFHKVQAKSRQFLIKTVYHICHLCKNTLLCDLHVLQLHIKMYHKISLEEYSKMTDCVVAKRKRNIPKSYLETLELSEELENACIYACNNLF